MNFAHTDGIYFQAPLNAQPPTESSDVDSEEDTTELSPVQSVKAAEFEGIEPQESDNSAGQSKVAAVLGEEAVSDGSTV